MLKNRSEIEAGTFASPSPTRSLTPVVFQGLQVTLLTLTGKVTDKGRCLRDSWHPALQHPTPSSCPKFYLTVIKNREVLLCCHSLLPPPHSHLPSRIPWNSLTSLQEPDHFPEIAQVREVAEDLSTQRHVSYFTRHTALWRHLKQSQMCFPTPQIFLFPRRVARKQDLFLNQHKTSLQWLPPISCHHATFRGT